MPDLNSQEIEIAGLNREQLETKVLREDILLKQQQRKLANRPWLFRWEVLIPILTSVLGFGGWGVSHSSEKEARVNLGEAKVNLTKKEAEIMTANQSREAAQNDLINLTISAEEGIFDLRNQVVGLRTENAYLKSQGAEIPETTDELDSPWPNGFLSDSQIIELINSDRPIVAPVIDPRISTPTSPRTNHLDSELLRIRTLHPERFDRRERRGGG